MPKILFSLFLTALALSTPLYAATPNPYIVMALGGGLGMTHDLGASQIFPIINPIDDENYRYSANHATQSTGLFNFFLGREWPLVSTFSVQAGLSYYFLNNFNAKGILTQGADAPSSDQFNYQYQIRTQQLLLETKWFYQYKHYHPYLVAGMGAALNSADQFNVDIPAFTTFTRLYQGNSVTSFSYNAGVGLDFDLNNTTRFGIGYRFADLGRVSLGNGTIDTSQASGTLSQSHLYVNEILAQLIFII